MTNDNNPMGELLGKTTITYIVVCTQHDSAIGPFADPDSAISMGKTISEMAPECEFRMVAMLSPVIVEEPEPGGYL